MALATVLGGGFMTLVHPFAASLPGEEYAAFGTMLRLLLLLAIPSAGLQVMFAQRSAAADPADVGPLATATRRTLGLLTGGWLLLTASTWLFQRQLVTALDLRSSALLWPTLVAAWVSLALPVFRGLVQGRQDFLTLGWTAILDGAGRLAAVFVLVVLFHGQAAAAMSAAVIAMLVSTALTAWTSRRIWLAPGGDFNWRPFVRGALPFTAGAGCLLVLSQSDLIFLKLAIPADLADQFQLSKLYQPAAQIGFAMTQFTVPLAAVMFPKIARSFARAEKSDALRLALIGTALLGTLAAIAATLLPELPLRILFFRTPANWVAAPLVPWCAWAMLSFALANVLANDRLARADFRFVPWAVGWAVAFLGTLAWLKPQFTTLQPLAAYRLVVAVIGGFNLGLLILIWLSSHRPRPDALRTTRNDHK
jgi:O-antigen/teichoic acid export membrane protein